MTDANPLAAEILETSASGYASAASALLMQDLERQALPDGWGSSEWHSHLKQRILELAAAVRVNEPKLFARRVNWLRRAVKARGASEADLRKAVESIRTALSQELPDALKSSVDQPIRLALAAFESEIEPEPVALDASTAHGRLGLNYLTACMEGQTVKATKLILEAIDQGADPVDIYADVLLPAQREIGQLWHLGDVSISEERLVSETTRETMSIIVHRCGPEAPGDKTVVAASVAGNAHDIGLRALSHLFRLDGWKAVFLGANVPSHEIAYAAETFSAEIVSLSATLTTQIGTLKDVIGTIREVTDRTKILVGGLAFEGSESLWKEIGADAYAQDIRSAVAKGNELITTR